MEDYVDITTEFFESLRHITGSHVVQSPYFDLLEGARAVEVTNTKLDTGLIPKLLTPEEILFNCIGPITEEQLVAIQNKILKALMSWLNNSALPLTVLSCRYVQHIVDMYSKLVDRKLSNFQIGESIYNKVLRSFILGLSKLIGVILTIGGTVLYEEEDLTTRAMDLNFLIEADGNEIFEDLTNTIELVSKSMEFKHRLIVVDQLELVADLNKLTVVTNLPINLFSSMDVQQYNFFVGILSQGIKRVENIQKNKAVVESFEVPKGSFSRLVQAKLDNRNIPGDLYEISFDQTFEQIQTIFVQSKDIFMKSNNLTDVDDLMKFLQYDIQSKIDDYHVLTRGIFQVFFIRDDQSIMGSSVDLAGLSFRIMDLVLFNCNIVNPKTWNLNTKDTSAVIEDLNKLIKEIDVATYQNLTIYANNRSRQRQIMNKSVLIWDSLQVLTENFEMSVYEKFNISDRLSDAVEMASPISSFVYYNKLKLMIEFLLSGIGLDLYKSYEIYGIYWYSNYLTKVLITHLTERIIGLNKYKIQRLAAKKKKLKNKAELEEKRQQIIKINEVLEQDLTYYSLLQNMLNCACLLLIYYEQQGFVKILETPSEFLVTADKLFKLRFKCFESIGVPAQLTFQQCQQSVTAVGVDQVLENFNLIKNGLLNYSRSAHPSQKEWINSLVKTCLMYTIEAKGAKAFEMATGYNEYFPRFCK